MHSKYFITVKSKKNTYQKDYSNPLTLKMQTKSEHYKHKEKERKILLQGCYMGLALKVNIHNELATQVIILDYL